jgi:putative transferase (TIGR04331 family)
MTTNPFSNAGDYHWDDPKKLSEDYSYLESIYLETLPLLTDLLNQLHQVEKSHKFWEVVIGPWLLYFLHCTYDRLSVVNSSFLFSLDIPKLRENGLEQLCPENISEFNSALISNEYQHSMDLLLSRDSQYLQSSKVVKHKKKSGMIGAINKNVSNSDKSSLLSIIYRTGFNRISKFLKNRSIDGGIFIFESNLSRFDQFKLQIRVGGFWYAIMQRYALRSTVPYQKYDLTDRSWKVSYLKPDKFKYWLSHLIPLLMPKSYIECFSGNIAATKDIGYPAKPKAVMATVSQLHDDFFKIWLASKVNKGTKFVIWQHGGIYGTGKINSQEFLELRVADKFLSWGWSNKTDKVLPIGLPPNWSYVYGKRKRIKSRRSKPSVPGKSSRLLLVLTDTGKFVPRIMSWPLGPQMAKHHFFILNLCQLLNEKFSGRLVVRPEKTDYGSHVKERYSEHLPSLVFDEKINFKESILSSGIVVFTSNLTSFLESIFFGKPSLLLLPLGYWEVRESASPDFQKLQNAGVLHYTIESIGDHLDTISENVDTWWASENVKSAIEDFKASYCWENKDIMFQLSHLKI